MEIAALAGWILAAVEGLHLLWIWLAGGGLRRQPAKVTRFPSLLMIGHPLVAVIGLILWVLFVVTARVVYAWSAFGLLVLVFLLGFLMLTRWLKGRGGRHARGAEQSFPLVAVAMHGAVAVATFVLVLLSAGAAATAGQG